MPIVSFTPGDALNSVLLKDDSYTGEIVEIKPPTRSSSDKSLLYWGTVVITQGEFKGKEFTICFCTGTKDPSVLGKNMFLPYSEMLVIQSVLEGEALAPTSKQFDTDDLLNREMDLKIKKTINNDGMPCNLITAWLPVGKATGPVPFN